MKITVNGLEVEAAIVDVLMADERWTELQLADGSVLRVKVIVTQVYRADAVRDGRGNPAYQFDFQVVHAIKPPDK